MDSAERGPLDPTMLGAQFLAEAGFSRLEILENIGSTNTELQRLAATEPRAWPDLSALVAEHQTAGRGRLDRHWASPRGASLSVSILLRPHGAAGRPLPTQSYSWLSPLAALALGDAVRSLTGLETGVKWPNDVVAHGRKISGILAQLVPGNDGGPPAVVLGIGVNVSLREEELPVPTATSLLIASGQGVTRTALLRSLLTAFGQRYRRFCAVDGDPLAVDRTPGERSLRDDVEAVTVTLGKRVRAELPGGSFLEGLASGLDAQGALLVQTGEGPVQTVSAGDVVHLRPADGGYA